MLTKLLSTALIVLVLQSVYAQPVVASTKAEKQAIFAGKVKAGIAKLGTGTDARVEVKLRDKRKIKGYISEANEDHFIINGETGVATTVAYPEVKQVKGNNLSQTVVFVIVVGGLVALAFALANAAK